jgi:hypothetical protein
MAFAQEPQAWMIGCTQHKEGALRAGYKTGYYIEPFGEKSFEKNGPCGLCIGGSYHKSMHELYQITRFMIDKLTTVVYNVLQPPYEDVMDHVRDLSLHGRA